MRSQTHGVRAGREGAKKAIGFIEVNESSPCVNSLREMEKIVPSNIMLYLDEKALSLKLVVFIDMRTYYIYISNPHNK